MEYMHSKNYLHRDIKPDNFLLGLSRKQHLIYIIDFGLSKQYRDAKTGDHIPYKDGKSLTGTVRYVSINTQIGVEQSRRDDLESLGFVYVYFLRSSLPWQGLKAKTKAEKDDAIKEVKISTTIEVLCKDTPQEFFTYLNYCRKLAFDGKPDYGYIRKLFKDLYVRKGFEYDFVYDWNTMKIPTADENKIAIKIDEKEDEEKKVTKQEIDKEELKKSEEIKKPQIVANGSFKGITRKAPRKTGSNTFFNKSNSNQ